MSNGSPKPKWAGRLNSAVRRSSTMLSFNRSSSSRPSSRPSSLHERDSSDSASITKQKVDTTSSALSPPVVSNNVAPSPINESPVREAAETQPPGPSPLMQEARTASPEPMDATSPVGYVPPPLVDSSIGNPGAFTDQMDEELPQPVVVSDPYLPSRPHSFKGAPSTRAPSIHEIPVPVSPSQGERPSQQERTTEPERSPTPPQDAPPIRDTPVHHDAPSPRDIFPSISEPEPTPAHSPTPPFDGPIGTAPSGNTVLREDAPGSGPFPAPVVSVPPIPFDITGAHSMPVPTHYNDSGPVSGQPVPPNDPVFRAMPIYELNSGTDIWGGDTHSYEPPKSNGHIKRNTNDDTLDPFSDPIAPRITLSDPNGPEMPSVHVSEPQPIPPVENPDEAHGVTLPLPSVHQIPSRPLRKPSSDYSFGDRNDVDETRPLLTKSKGTSYLQQPTTAVGTRVNVSPMNGSSGSWNHQSLAAVPKLHDLGWIEYHLPDGTFYYVHPTRRVTTDVNLRTEKILNSVTVYLENVKESAPSGCELWLTDAGNPKKGFVPRKSWVNHQTRSVLVEDRGEGGRKKKRAEEDQLDMEYRYWSFMEGHPAHSTLPLNAKTEAFEALSWAWTDRLLPSNQVVPAPFSQEECQELNNLLRSFTADQDGIQTRLVARILLRVAIWRQAFFRPNKPLPKDVVCSVHPVVRRPRPIRAFFDILVSIVCLGIPYIFFERHTQHRIDEESNFRSAGPMFIIGACTCIVAAIVLSASVTFLSLPGVDALSRIPGLVATLFASFSMAATLVAIFKYKADVMRNAPQIGEGVMWISKRSLIFSLPMVFLAYAIIGFITAIVLYSIRGTAFPNLEQNNVGPYLRWTTVGAVGALAGAFTMSVLLFRR